MANVVGIQTLVDDARNTVVKVDMLLDTSDLGSTTVVDPALLSPAASALRIDKMQFDVEDTLAVNLFWDAASPVSIWRLDGRGNVEAKEFGGLINNAGAGKTGKITMTTQGFTGGAALSASFVLSLAKMGV